MTNETKFKDLYAVSRDQAHFTYTDEFEKKKNIRRIYLEKVIEEFEKLEMSCEEYEKPEGEISNYSFLIVAGVYMIIDNTGLEFSESRMLQNGQEALVNFLKQGPSDDLVKLTNTKYINIEFESPQHFQRFYKIHNLHLFINDNLKGLNKAGLFEKTIYKNMITRFKDYSENWKDSEKLKRFNDLTGAIEQKDELVRKQYDFSTDKNGATIVQIKNGQDFPYKIVSKDNIFKVYKGDQQRSYTPLKFYFKKDFTSMNDVYGYIIKQHNKSAEYMHWPKIEA